MAQHGDPPGHVAMRHTPIYRDPVLLQLAVLFFLADQFSKFLVRHFVPWGESLPDQGFFRITHTFNTGSAFGLFRDQNVPLILASVIGITVLVLIYRSQPRPGRVLRLSLALQLGGAAGNLLDRLRLGHVTDFVDVGRWPVFNLADSSIVIGLVLLAWLFLQPDQRRRARRAAPTVAESEQDGRGPALPGADGPAAPPRERDPG